MLNDEIKVKKIEKIKQIIFGVMLFVAVLLLLIFIDKRIDYLLDSDTSSEVFLGQIMASNNSLITKAWYYSTELRVVGINTVYMLVFKFLTNWHWVRIWSCFIFYVLMLFSYSMYCKKINLKKYLILSSVLFMIPFSECYFNFVLIENQYVPYIVFSFILYGLIESNTAKIRKGLSVLLFCVSLIFSLNGIRQLIIFHFPVFLSAIIIFVKENIDKEKINLKETLESNTFKYLVSSLISIFGAFCGYIINTKILTKIYQFQDWNNILFSKFDIQKIGLLINNILESYGWRTGDVFSTVLISNVSCVFFIGLTVISIVYAIKNSKKVSKEYLHLSLFYLSAIVIFFGLYACTNMIIAARYNLPIIVFSIPLIFLFVKEVDFKNKDIMKYKNLILYAFVLILCMSSLCNYNYWRYTDKTLEKRKIADVLVEKEYFSGYATFWQANVVTELSNGKIDIWSWCDSGDNGEGLKDITDINTTFEWLQKTSHKNNYPSGKVFLLFTIDEFNNFNWKDQLEKYNEIIYQSDYYIIYGFNNYDDMIDIIKST